MRRNQTKRKTRRLLPLLALLCGLLSAREAQAVCSTCCAGCAVPAIVGGFSAIAAERVAADLYIMESIGALQVGIGTSQSGVAVAKRKAAEKALEAAIYSEDTAAYRSMIASQVVPDKPQTCRLLSASKAEPKARMHSQALRGLLEDAYIEGYFSRNTTGESFRTSHLQRLCRNGLVKRDDYGERWFTENGCFEDTAMERKSFEKLSTITGKWVLVPPSTTAMTCLNNPNEEGAGACNPQTTWTGLNQKQKDYVAALRYCESLMVANFKDATFTGDQASSMANMPRIVDNFAELSRMSLINYMCTSELAYRTAPDPALMDAAAAEQERTGNRRIGNALAESGMPRSVFEVTPATGAPEVYVSPALLQYARTKGFCTNPAVQTSFNEDNGTDSNLLTNKLLCGQIVVQHQSFDDAHHNLLINVATQAGRLDREQEAIAPIAAPARANLDTGSALRQVSLSSAPAAAPVRRMTLREMLSFRDAAPAGQAAAPAR